MAQDREASGHLLMPAIVPLRPRRWAGSGPAAVRNERRPAPGLSTGASCAQVTGGGTGGGDPVCSVPTGYNRPHQHRPRVGGVVGGR